MEIKTTVILSKYLNSQQSIVETVYHEMCVEAEYETICEIYQRTKINMKLYLKYT